PKSIVWGERVTVVVDPLRTDSVRLAELLAKLVLPRKSASTVWLPSVPKAEMNVATPAALSTALVRGLPSTSRLTLPTGTRPPAEVTVTVNVTGRPTAAGFADGVRTVVVPDWSTVWISVSEAPLLKWMSPAYWATIVCVPTARLFVVNVATPP